LFGQIKWFGRGGENVFQDESADWKENNIFFKL